MAYDAIVDNLTVVKEIKLQDGSTKFTNADGNDIEAQLAVLDSVVAGELELIDGLTAGTVTASKAVTADANKDCGDFRNLDCTNLDAGASGTAGTVEVFPSTASKGKFKLACQDQDADTAVTLQPAAMGQASVVSIPDPGAATANVMLTDQANDGAPVTASSAELNVLDGVTAGTSAASSGVVLDSEQQLNSIGVIRSVDKIISTAEVKALNGTPIAVLPAVGAGYSPVFLGAYVLLDYNSAAYVDDAGEDLVFQQLSAGDEVSQTADGAMFDGTADAIVWVGPKGGEAIETGTLVDNGGFEVTIQTGEWITGDSPLKIRLYYRLVKKSELEAIA